MDQNTTQSIETAPVQQVQGSPSHLKSIGLGLTMSIPFSFIHLIVGTFLMIFITGEPAVAILAGVIFVFYAGAALLLTLIGFTIKQYVQHKEKLLNQEYAIRRWEMLLFANIGLFFLGGYFLFAQAGAALEKKPECVIRTDKNSYTPSETVTLTWETKNADRVVMSAYGLFTEYDDKDLPAQGVATDIAQPLVLYDVTGTSTIPYNPQIGLRLTSKKNKDPSKVQGHCEVRFNVVAE